MSKQAGTKMKKPTKKELYSIIDTLTLDLVRCDCAARSMPVPANYKDFPLMRVVETVNDLRLKYDTLLAAQEETK